MAASDTVGPSRFLGVTQEPEDAILGITLAFKKDTHPDKLNLGVGAYRTEEGKPFVLEIVRQAERYLAEQPDIYKEYLPIDGLAEFRSVSAKLVFGKDSSALCEGRIATVQALSGTGSLRIGAAFAKRLMPDASVYLSTPTWGNHPKVFTHAEVPIKKYRYFKPSTRGLDFEGMYEDIENAPDGSIILLHGCAHNPTGVDPTHEQWSKLCTLLRTKRHLPFFDVAYQGFASGDLDRDAWAVRHFVAEGMECFVAQSYAKNFGLYGERVGALHVVSRDPTTVSPILSQLKTIIRPMYSNPPAHGARIVVHVLENEERFADWKKELKGMASRIEEMRTLLYEELNRLGIRGPWDHIKKQIGMFTFTGLRAAQVECLTKEWHIYMTRDGRISMAGLSKRTVPYLARAIGAVGGLSVEE